MASINTLVIVKKLYEKKKDGIPLAENELSAVEKLKGGRLLRTITDPSVKFSFLQLEEYYPSLLEVEVAFYAVTGREPARDLSMVTMLEVIGRALEYAEQLELVM